MKELAESFNIEEPCASYCIHHMFESRVSENQFLFLTTEHSAYSDTGYSDTWAAIKIIWSITETPYIENQLLE